MDTDRLLDFPILQPDGWRDFMCAAVRFLDENHLRHFVVDDQERLKVNHLAIKCPDTTGYEDLRHLARLNCHTMTETFMDRRRIAVVRFNEPLVFELAGTVLGCTHLMEIIQRRPTDLTRTNDFVLDHLDLTYTLSFEEMKGELTTRGIPHNLGPDEDASQHTLAIVFDDRGREIKLDNLSLAEQVALELRGDIPDKPTWYVKTHLLT